MPPYGPPGHRGKEEGRHGMPAPTALQARVECQTAHVTHTQLDQADQATQLLPSNGITVNV